VIEASRILVRCPNWVGDAVMATPVLRCLRANYPHAHISLLLRPYVRGIFDHGPWHDDVIEILPRAEFPGTLRFMRLAARLRAERYDLGILLPGAFKTAALALAGGVRNRVGYRRDLRGWTLTRAVHRPSDNGKFRPTYMGDFYLALCETAGCEVRDRMPAVFTTEEEDQAARTALADRGVSGDKPIIALCPGASFGSSKLWPAERWAAVADRLADEQGVDVVLTGAPTETELADQVVSRARCRVASLVGAPGGLALLKSVVKQIHMMVTVDSGSRHLAVAQQKPTVVLMGPTSPDYTATPLERGELIRVDVDCGPCQEKRCVQDHRCMQGITVDKVYGACERLLGKPRKH